VSVRGAAGAAALAAALLLGACAALPPELPEVAACRTNYLGFDEKAAAADARDGGAHRIAGFPYLRVDRFLASFRDAAVDGPAFEAWVERLRQLDLAARRAELRNLGWAEPAEELGHLDRCGRDWAARDLASPARRAQLRAAAVVPDDYSMLRRTLGFYPVAVPFLNLGINGFNDEVRADYAKPLALLDATGRPVLWAPEGRTFPARSEPPWPRSAPPDGLGIPVITPALWTQLLQRHAPVWQIETDGDFDRPGAPLWRDDAPAVDVARPVTYALTTYTRFGDKVLPQLVYVVWFSERPKSGVIDSYAGALDGVVWRVTLDTDGNPLLYDTIHPCGCYHYYFTAKPLARKPQGGFWQEPVLFPQDAPERPFAIRIQSRTHYVRRLVPLDAAAGEKREYALADYADLLTLADGHGGTRSLFCENGLACGTERFERFWLWPAGIASAGAMRQWGRHATSFVGRSHFDDPAMLDRLFEKP
jgi:hypothetical protein